VAEDRSLSWRSYKSKDQIHQGDSDE
jgi:hypothetical protein